MENHLTGWPPIYETPLGMICLYGKVMEGTDEARTSDIVSLPQMTMKYACAPAMRVRRGYELKGLYNLITDRVPYAMWSSVLSKEN